eukprot:m.109257 g.109257  ORF g.109257 m.109257 type:complete len:259 (-) comp12839_c0_seq6:2053-2829(-)
MCRPTVVFLKLSRTCSQSQMFHVLGGQCSTTRGSHQTRGMQAAVDSSRSGIVHNDTLLNPAHTLGDCKIKHGASLRISPDSSTTKLVKRRATASEPVRTEQELANEILPELTQQNLGALKEALGPKHIAFKDTEVQVAERTELLRAIQQRIDSGGFGDEKEMTNNFMTKMALDVQRLSAVLDSRRTEFEAALSSPHRDSHAAETRRVRRCAGCSRPVGDCVALQDSGSCGESGAAQRGCRGQGCRGRRVCPGASGPKS